MFATVHLVRDAAWLCAYGILDAAEAIKRKAMPAARNSNNIFLLFFHENNSLFL